MSIRRSVPRSTLVRHHVECICMLMLLVAGGMVGTTTRSHAAELLHLASYASGDSARVDTAGSADRIIWLSGEALFSFIGFAGGFNADLRLFSTGGRSGIRGSARGFFCFQYVGSFGGTGHGSGGGESDAIIGLNLQLAAYTGNFEANVGVGVARLSSEFSDDAGGAVTDVSTEFRLRLGAGPLALLLTGRLFVEDWSRSIVRTDNALLYGGIGLRYEF